VSFLSRYGPWALVAGASEGIGAAFATALADQGLNVMLVARRPEPLAALAEALPTRTRTVTADLSTVEGLAAVEAADTGLEIGLLVCNAGYAPDGALLDQSPGQPAAVLDTNARAPLLLARRYLPEMVARGRGGLIVMSSLAGQQGTPGLATHAATKAFGTVLAEGAVGGVAPARRGCAGLPRRGGEHAWLPPRDGPAGARYGRSGDGRPRRAGRARAATTGGTGRAHAGLRTAHVPAATEAGGDRGAGQRLPQGRRRRAGSDAAGQEQRG
jgi:hypothetical protein